MNRTILSLLSLLTVTGTLAARAQAPPVNPPTNSTIVQSRISRFIAGPGDRPQGLLLRDGTFVNLSPGLSLQLPSSFPEKASVQVAGDALTYNGSRTIEAHNITIAGITYNEGPADPTSPCTAAVPRPPAPGVRPNVPPAPAPDDAAPPPPPPPDANPLDVPPPPPAGPPLPTNGNPPPSPEH
jgi:hypothetical protein